MARGTIGICFSRAAITSGLSSCTAVEVTTASAPAMFSAAWPRWMLAPMLCQPLCHRIVGEIGAGDGIAQIQQHLGDAAHAGAADADKMDVFDGVFHFANASQISATCRVASGLASARACPTSRQAFHGRGHRSAPPVFPRLRSFCCISHAAPASLRKRRCWSGGRPPQTERAPALPARRRRPVRPPSSRRPGRWRDRTIPIGSGHVFDVIADVSFHAGGLIVGFQGLDMLAAGLMHDRGRWSGRDQGERLRQQLVERLRRRGCRRPPAGAAARCAPP